jgi:hypothetical protein
MKRESWQLNLPIIFHSYGKSYEPFELFCFCMPCVLTLFAYRELKKLNASPSPEKCIQPLTPEKMEEIHGRNQV